MTEVLISADDEDAVVVELNARTSIKWGTKIPNPRIAEFGRVVSVGGSDRDLVTDSATLTIEGFATGETRAREICALGVAHLQAAARDGVVGGVPCYGARAVSRPANLPMPSVPDQFRFTATVSVDLRKATV